MIEAGRVGVCRQLHFDTATGDQTTVATWMHLPHFDRTATLNTAVYCASVSRNPADQRLYEHVPNAAVDLYGSDDRGRN
jgi:hypothetical protein